MIDSEDCVPGYIKKIKINVDGYCSREYMQFATTEGFISVGLGKDIIKLSTNYQTSIEDSFAILRCMVSQISTEVSFTAFRNAKYMGNQKVWNRFISHVELDKTLKDEIRGRGKLVDKLTGLATLDVHFGGQKVDWYGPAGVMLVNFFANIGPFLAKRAHQASRSGVGHLAVYQKSALSERLPDYNRWFVSPDEMISHIDSLPQLPVGGAYLENNPGIKSVVDDCQLFWFAQPKMSEQGKCLKLQYLHSMPLYYAKASIQEGVSVTEHLLEWFFEENQGKLVVSKDQALPAFEYLADKLNFDFPAKPLAEEEWLDLVNNY